ncbi:MAG TPA: DinB family protein [Terracidiphilus sp.]|jgi:uncharacterized damage-inducible protein DinB|nr:DinB family protein [Terracidiphilus sp.]
MLATQSTATIAESMLAEFETQTAVTRRFLERLPEDRLTWKPHDRSMTAGQLAYHLASVPAGVARLVESNPAPAPKAFTYPQPASVKEILDTLDESLVTVRVVLPRFDDAAMAETWRLAVDGAIVVEQPRGVFLRNVMLSHWYQHRGQFSVYLRLLNIAVPASWGPSGDEPSPLLQKRQPV